MFYLPWQRMGTHLVFNKEHILISRRYNLHLAYATTQCPSDNTDAQNKK
jgi:hypothetical protein